MAWPKQINPREKKQVATAPYNFVPLPEAIVTVDPPPDQDQYYSAEAEHRYTGYLDCTLTTLTPLYTRCMMTPEFFAKYGDKAFYDLDKAQQDERAPFFYLDDIEKPMISGSSLRGMTRALVEIVGYGKVQPVSNERLIYRSVGDMTSFGTRYRERVMHDDGKNMFTPLMKAGYMEKHGLDWYIRPAQEINGVTFARIWQEGIPRQLPYWHGCKNARRLWVKIGPYAYKKVRHIQIKYADVQEYSAKKEPGLVEVAYTWSGPMNKKKFDMVVFPEDTGAELIPVPQEMVTTYREQISQEQAKLLGQDGVLQHKQPVFYLQEAGKLVFFSHTKMMRLPYPHSPQDFVPPELRPADKVDLAEAMFGYINLNIAQKPSAAGRVSFTDAELAANQQNVFLSDEPITLKILGGPKPTSFQHYLVQETPDPQVIGKTKDGRPKTQVHLSHYASQTPQQTVLRGHKAYWHQQVGLDDIVDKQAPEKSTQHTRVQPVKEGVTFKFKVHFESLSEVELGALLWALDLPAGCHHKLGMGRPLGMGSVNIEPQVVLTKRKERYTTLFTEDYADWFSAVDPAEDIDSYKQAFEGFVLAGLGKAGETLTQQERIQALLAILSWDNRPDPGKIEYMGLSAFRYRPVLPTPQGVLGQPQMASASPQTVAPPQAAPQAPAPAAPPPKYPLLSEVKAKIVGKWSKGRTEVELEGGERGFLKASRKDIEKIGSELVLLVVTDFKNNIYTLELP